MNSKIMKGDLLVAVAILGGLLIPCIMASKAYAIPAFSRLYKKECVTCHTMYPERNDYGDAFEKNGYYPPEGMEKVVAVKGSNTPDVLDPLAAVGIPSQVPVSIWGMTNITYNKNNPELNNHPQFDFDAGSDLSMMAAGNFLGKVAYWGDYDFSAQQTGEVFIQLMRPVNMPINIKIGKFEPKTSLWKSNDNAMVAEFAHLSKFVDSAFSNGAFTGDPNFTLDTHQGGVELNSVILPRLFFATGITNGLTKTTNAKDWYGHVSTRIGGADFKGNEPDIDLEHMNFFDYLSLTLGSYGYVGSSNNSTNDFYRAGIDAELDCKQAKLKLGGVYGNDDDPRVPDLTLLANPIADQRPARSKMAFVQGEYLFNSMLLTSLRLEIENIENQNVARRVIPSVSYTPVQNLKLTLEYLGESVSVEGGPGTHNDQATFNVSCAF